jgi:hypothetical protein
METRPSLTSDDLAAIAERADLTYTYGDWSALKAEDVAALLAEVRALQAQNTHLVALVRQARDKLTAERIQRGHR